MAPHNIHLFERCSPTACGCKTEKDCPNRQPVVTVKFSKETEQYISDKLADKIHESLTTNRLKTIAMAPWNIHIVEPKVESRSLSVGLTTERKKNLQAALDTEFWKGHKIGDRYEFKNRNGSKEVCQIAYYPLDNYQDFTALIEIKKDGYNDFREVPIRFLTKQNL